MADKTTSQDEGRFPKEPDEGDTAVIDRELARQKGGSKPADAPKGGEGGMDDKQKDAVIDSTKGLP